MLRLSVLGGLSLRSAAAYGDADALVAQPKRLAVLLYLALALPQGFHRRDVLLAMFWPGSSRVEAGRSLRQALHFLRQRLPAGVLVSRGRDEIGLAPGRLDCDLRRFEAALDAADERAALALYRGDLLPGFYIAGCPDFEHWLEAERSRVRRRAVRAAVVLTEQAALDGRPIDAVEWAGNALARADGDELIAAECVTLLVRAGQPGAARGIWHDFVQRLEADYQVAPSTELRSRVEATLAGGSAIPAAPSDLGAGPTRMRAATTRPLRATPAARRADGPAYHAYLRGLHSDQHRSPAATRLAITHYYEAIRLEPDFAQAHLGLARAWAILPSYAGCLPSDAYPRARHHAAKALRLDPSLSEAHGWLAHAMLCYDWDWAGAEGEWLRGLGADPNASELRVAYSMYLLAPTGRTEQALAEIERARAIAPTSLPMNAYVGMVCYLTRLYERAEQEARVTLELDDRLPLAWWVLGLATEQTGDIDTATAAFERASELTGQSPLMLAQLARVHAVAGRRDAAQRLLDSVCRVEPSAGRPAVFIASAHAALGDTAAAFSWLGEAYRERAPHLVTLPADPCVDPLRGDRRFRELLRRIGTAPRPAGLASA